MLRSCSAPPFAFIPQSLHAHTLPGVSRIQLCCQPHKLVRLSRRYRHSTFWLPTRSFCGSLIAPVGGSKTYVHHESRATPLLSIPLKHYSQRTSRSFTMSCFRNKDVVRR